MELTDLDIENLKNNFIDLLKSTKREGIDNLISFIEKTDFFRAPASTRFHGSYKGGLLVHSLNVYECLLEQISIPVFKEKIKDISKKMEGHYQKAGIVKYDAFHEMGGNLSFALTMLDQNNNGWIFNAMHSREGCYTYIKEIVKGESYIELSEEEQQCLEKAIYQEEYDIKDMKE